jgi:hypothetical protein
VRRTYEYDQEMAKQMREANFKITEGFPLHKEYPEGYKWIELAPRTIDELKGVHADYVRKDFPDLEKTDLGGGKIAVTYGNSLVVVDTSKKNERIPLGDIKKFEQDNYQAILNKAARTYPSWDKVPDQIKELLASLKGVYGAKDTSGMTMSPDVAFDNRFAELRGTQAPSPQNPMLSPPSGFTSTQPVR